LFGHLGRAVGSPNPGGFAFSGHRKSATKAN
jgi:hypothetical protein